MVIYTVLPFIAFAAGILSAMTGGSGMVILPALLMAGIPPHIAVGTNKLFTTAGLLTSAMTFIRKGFFNPRACLAACLSTLIGGLAGALIVMVISNQSLKYILPITLLGMTLYLLFPKELVLRTQYNLHPNSLPSQILSLMFGIYSGAIGAGTGMIWTAVSMRLFDTNLLEASALSRFMCFLANVSALIVFMVLKQVDYTVGLSLITMSILGAFVGTKLAIKHGNKLIKPALFSVACIMTVKLAYESCL